MRSVLVSFQSPFCAAFFRNKNNNCIKSVAKQTLGLKLPMKLVVSTLRCPAQKPVQRVEEFSAFQHSNNICRLQITKRRTLDIHNCAFLDTLLALLRQPNQHQHIHWRLPLFFFSGRHDVFVKHSVCKFLQPSTEMIRYFCALDFHVASDIIYQYVKTVIFLNYIAIKYNYLRFQQ